MTARRGRARECNRADGRVRLDDATRFLATVDALASAGIDVGNDVLATNAIHAAIAAADDEVTTCRRVAARLIEAAQRALQAAGPS